MLALIFAAAFAPWMEWTRRHKLPPALGAALALVFLLALIAGALVFVVGSVGHEWRELAIKAQDGFQRVLAWLQTLPFSPDQRQLDDLTERISGFLTSAEFGSGALGGIGAVTEVTASLGMMAIILFFFLKDGPQMWEFLARPFEGIAYDRAERIRRKTVNVFGGYISSTAAAALFDAVGIFIGLLILQVPLAVPLAILTFLLAFIPIIGAVSAGAVAALVALVTNGPLNAALVVLVVIIVNQLEGERAEADPHGQDGQPPSARRARRHRRGHRRRRNRRSPHRRPADCRGLGRRASVGRRRPPPALGTPEDARSGSTPFG